MVGAGKDFLTFVEWKGIYEYISSLFNKYVYPSSWKSESQKKKQLRGIQRCLVGIQVLGGPEDLNVLDHVIKW